MPASLIYIYDLNNTLKGRIVNGVTQNFVYDKKGQLTGVTDSNGAVLKSYKYDAAGNILEKVINGAAVNYTYDKANQLLTATMPDGIRKSYKYDAAGRLVEETAGTSSKSYSYGWSDKVTKVSDGKVDTNFSYYPNGQLAKRSTDKTSENFYWDGLALLKRDNTNYLNEPYVTGGNPVLADDKLVFNDMIGTSIGSMEDGNFKYIPRTAFGETEDKSDVNFFTGKPDVADLGYNFMFRNYRADLGKWQTQDPLGYPDGWNNFAYCNNWVMYAIDVSGGKLIISGGTAFEDNVYKSLRYLVNSKIGSKIISKIVNSEKEITLKSGDYWPSTNTLKDYSSATTTISGDMSILYEANNGTIYSFSGALMWEISNAYWTCIEEDLQGEANGTADKSNAESWYSIMKELEGVVDPYPIIPTKKWKEGWKKAE